MSNLAFELSEWATDLDPSSDDLRLAERSLIDTVAVTLAARDARFGHVVSSLDEASRWASVGHFLDFDDLHVSSTTHVSVVCVAATLATAGDSQAYLAGAGVMARLGDALGWAHYADGWHATCTAGAPAAAVAAGVAIGLKRDQLAQAIALAIPAAGGVQRAFGTDGKSLQVGFAVGSGVRAARLVAAGATADAKAVDDWFGLVGGGRSELQLDGPAIPGGLAVKYFPCCYALQRVIVAVQASSSSGLRAEDVVAVHVSTPEVTLQPLVHHRPTTALEGKFSLEYAVAATILDHVPGLRSFTDLAVRREQAQRLIRCVEVTTQPGGDSLLSGEVTIELELRDARVLRSRVSIPPGAPGGPSDEAAFSQKLESCGALVPELPQLLAGLNWREAPELLRSELGMHTTSRQAGRWESTVA